MSETPQDPTATDPAEGGPEATPDVADNEQSVGDKTEPADAPAPDAAGTGS